MGNPALISVIIPVYNGERYLAEAIESALAQTYGPLDILIVDDGSTDGSSAIAKSYEPVRYVFQPHRGLSAALNSGVQVANGSFFAFLDSDDTWVENKLTCQMAAFGRDPDLDIVLGHVQQFYSPELEDSLKKEMSGHRETVPGYSKGAMLIKRDSFFRVGLFDTRWQLGDFVDWYIRATEEGLESLILPEVTTNRRIHDDNMSARERHAEADYVRILKASLDRRRKSDVQGQETLTHQDEG